MSLKCSGFLETDCWGVQKYKEKCGLECEWDQLSSSDRLRRFRLVIVFSLG